MLPLFWGSAQVRRQGQPPAQAQGLVFPLQEMPKLKSAPHAPDPPSLTFNPLTGACLPNSNNSSKRQHEGPGLTNERVRISLQLPWLCLHILDTGVFCNLRTREKGIFDVSLAKN